MPRTKRWKTTFKSHGGYDVALSHWKYFPDYLRDRGSMFDRTSSVWRGHASRKWPLRSTLERLLDKLGKPWSVDEREKQLQRFKLSARGRRSPFAPVPATENDWWALGQHYGLATPLLDWTRAPFVALYFAFQSEDTEGDSHRAVWVLNRRNLDQLASIVLKKDADTPVVTFIEPTSDENARLVNQGGLLTRSPDGLAIVDWVEKHAEAKTTAGTYIKIEIPNKDRTGCLRMLNQMNINQVTLFPDLFGASQACNAALEMGYA